MTLKTQRNPKLLGSFGTAIKSRVAGAPADEARAGRRWQGDFDRRACPGVYALLVGVPRR